MRVHDVFRAIFQHAFENSNLLVTGPLILQLSLDIAPEQQMV